MRKGKILIAVAAAGLVAAAGSAVTAGGLVNGAGASAFVGGSVNQSITGATLTVVAYDVDEVLNEITSVTLTFSGADADGKTPTIAFAGGGATGAYTCAIVVASSSVCGFNVTKADSTATDLTITVA